MPTVRLAYRDNDRTPVIYCIKAMAERHYGVSVEVVQIEQRHPFEDALFNNSCDVIIEHIEYLYPEAAKGKKITFFCAPQIHRGLNLVVPQGFAALDELRARTMPIRLRDAESGGDEKLYESRGPCPRCVALPAG